MHTIVFLKIFVDYEDQFILEFLVNSCHKISLYIGVINNIT